MEIFQVKKQAQITDTEHCERKESKIPRKLETGAPYNFFLTKIRDCPDTHNALDSLSSLHINFMVDLELLLMKYWVTLTKDRTLVILYGVESLSQPPVLREVCPSCRVAIEEPKYPYGTLHTKMMLLTYEDGGLRVVVHTANLVPGNLENRTPGLRVSDECPIHYDRQ